MTLVSTFNDHILSNQYLDYYYGFSSHIESLKYLDLESVQASYSQILAGDKVNVSENRSVTHFQARSLASDHRQLIAFIDNIHSSKTFSSICHIGVGGSFSGVKFVSHALNTWSQPQHIPLTFISNHDEDHIESVLSQLDVSKTLFVIVSKSGTTIEVEKILEAVIHSQKNPNFIKEQCITVTMEGSLLDSNDYLDSFTFDEGVGGRFSTTSYVGLVSLGLSYGVKVLNDLLEGARLSDDHSMLGLSENMALMQATHRFFQQQKYKALSVVPYGQALSHLPVFMGQLICESLGKSITKKSEALAHSPAPYLMHGVGPEAQHTFFQQIHQGLDVIPVEFLFSMPTTDNQTHMLKQIIGQMVSLYEGHKNDDLNYSFSGNRPSTLTIFKSRSAAGLGYFISMFENRIIFEGILNNINPFDQPGVELGKKITASIDDETSKAYQIYDIVRDQLNVKS